MDAFIPTPVAFLIALGFVFIGPERTLAQTSSAGARNAALAGSSAAPSRSGALWSDLNPAGYSQIRRSSAAIHGAQLYGLPELRLGAVRAGFSLGGTAVIGGVRTFGYSDYRETLFSTGLARAFRWGTHRPFQAGIRVRYHRIAVRSYGTASALALSGGLVFPVAPGTDLGLAAENMLVAFGRLGDELPRRLHAGIAVAARSVTLMAGASKDVQSPLSPRFGVEIHPVDILALRAGYSIQPARISGGIGLHLAPLTIDIAAERHVVLGWTPSCSVGVSW